MDMALVDFAALLSFPFPPASLGRLVARYAEPHRRYHDWAHVLACLEARHEIEGAALPAVDLALLFHDAIYEPLAHDNEARSAALLEEEARRAWLHEELIQRARGLVLATKHAGGEPDSEEACIVVDADLSILGARDDVFDAYERGVREEYAVVDDEAYATGRAAVLRGFLARPAIYTTRRGVELWEARARANLTRSLGRLT
jgi:predicted metal-dependent HD superfamily phosphohydrolase